MPLLAAALLSFVPCTASSGSPHNATHSASSKINLRDGRTVNVRNFGKMGGFALLCRRFFRWSFRSVLLRVSRGEYTRSCFGLQERAISVTDSGPKNELSPANEPHTTDDTDPWNSGSERGPSWASEPPTTDETDPWDSGSERGPSWVNEPHTTDETDPWVSGSICFLLWKDVIEAQVQKLIYIAQIFMNKCSVKLICFLLQFTDPFKPGFLNTTPRPPHCRSTHCIQRSRQAHWNFLKSLQLRGSFKCHGDCCLSYIEGRIQSGSNSG